MLKRILLTLATSAVVSCTGCGGGGTSESEPSPEASTPPPTQPFVVVAYGDSTQAGLNTATPEVVPPASIAQQVLREQLARDNITVRSEGIGGTNSQNLLDGTDGSGLPWAQRVATSGADVVTINHGINDTWLPLGRTDAEYRVILTALVTTAQAGGKTVVLETPNPMVPGTQTSVHFDIPGLDRKAQVMREVAAATGAILCDEKAEIERRGMTTLRWLPDGVHPHKTLYQAKGITLAACLTPLIR